MTRKEAKRRAELYSALAEGKKIQFNQENGEWADLTMELIEVLSESAFRYRIKPEPEFVPFESTEEFLEAQREHGGGLINILDGEVLNANDIYISINGNVCKGKETQIGYNLYPIGDLKDLFKNYKLIDCTPCGKSVEL